MRGYARLREGQVRHLTTAPPPTGSNQQKQSSRMTGCEWKGRMRWEADEEGNGASAGWQFTTEEPRHNHPASGELALPQFRKRNEYAIQRIKLSMDNRDSAIKILRNMRLSGDNIRLSGVSNELSKLRRDELGGRTRIEALVDFLEEYSYDNSGLEGTKFYSNITKDGNNQARIVFFSHPQSFHLVKCNPDVIQIDATYKTNAFHMPLVHIVGITVMGKTYDVAYAFIPNELGETYAEVVQMLYDLFEKLDVVPKAFITDHDRSLKAGLKAIFPDVPQRRCIWHIMQNVQTEAVKAWNVRNGNTDQEKSDIEKARTEYTQTWQSLVSCTTEEAFWALKDMIWASYAEYPDLLQYLDAHQLPYYAEWAECICKYIPDFGQRATSRIEGAHRTLKLALTSWRAGQIYDVVKDIHSLVLIQRSEHDARLQKDETRIASDCIIPEFARLHRKITHQGLRKLKEQLLMAKSDEYNDLEECSGAFSAKFGLPCKHTLHRQLNKQETLVIDPKDLHQQWWFRPERAATAEVQDERYILDPEKVKPKGRPAGAATVTLPLTQASRSIRGRQPERQPREKTRNEHVQATQSSQQAEEAPEDDPEFRRGSRRRQPTQKAREMIEDAVVISSAEESSSGSDSEAEVVVQEVIVTCTTKKVTQKVTKKPAKKPTRDDLILAALTKLEAQNLEFSERLSAFQKAQEVSNGFVDIDIIDITSNSPQKQPRKKRKAIQRKQPSLHASNSQ
jgi:hypothetical protein